MADVGDKPRFLLPTDSHASLNGCTFKKWDTNCKGFKSKTRYLEESFRKHNENFKHTLNDNQGWSKDSIAIRVLHPYSNDKEIAQLVIQFRRLCFKTDIVAILNAIKEFWKVEDVNVTTSIHINGATHGGPDGSNAHSKNKSVHPSQYYDGVQKFMLEDLNTIDSTLFGVSFQPIGEMVPPLYPSSRIIINAWCYSDLGWYGGDQITYGLLFNHEYIGVNEYEWPKVDEDDDRCRAGKCSACKIKSKSIFTCKCKKCLKKSPNGRDFCTALCQCKNPACGQCTPHSKQCRRTHACKKYPTPRGWGLFKHINEEQIQGLIEEARKHLKEQEEKIILNSWSEDNCVTNMKDEVHRFAKECFGDDIPEEEIITLQNEVEESYRFAYTKKKVDKTARLLEGVKQDALAKRDQICQDASDARVCVSQMNHAVDLYVNEFVQKDEFFKFIPPNVQERIQTIKTELEEVFEREYETRYKEKVNALIEATKQDFVKKEESLPMALSMEDLVAKMNAAVDVFVKNFVRNDDFLKEVPRDISNKIKADLKQGFKDAYDKKYKERESALIQDAKRDVLEKKDQILLNSTDVDNCVSQMHAAVDAFTEIFFENDEFLKTVDPTVINSIKFDLEPVFKGAYENTYEQKSEILSEALTTHVLLQKDQIVLQATDTNDCVLRMNATCDAFVNDFVESDEFFKTIPTDVVVSTKNDLEKDFQLAYETKYEEELRALIEDTQKHIEDQKRDILDTSTDAYDCITKMKSRGRAHVNNYVEANAFLKEVPQKEVDHLLNQLHSSFHEAYQSMTQNALRHIENVTKELYKKKVDAFVLNASSESQCIEFMYKHVEDYVKSREDLLSGLMWTSCPPQIILNIQRDLEPHFRDAYRKSKGDSPSKMAPIHPTNNSRSSVDIDLLAVVEMIRRWEENCQQQNFHCIHEIAEGRYVIQFNNELTSEAVKNLLKIIYDHTRCEVHANLGTRGEEGGFFVRRPAIGCKASDYTLGPDRITPKDLDYLAETGRFAYTKVTESQEPVYPKDVKFTINAWSYSDCFSRSIVYGECLEFPKVLLLGKIGAGKTTLLKSLMPEEQRKYYEARGKLEAGVNSNGITQSFEPYLLDFGYGRRYVMYDSPGIDDYGNCMELLAQTSKLFSVVEFSSILVVLPSIDDRLGVGSRILSVIVEEGVLRDLGNRDMEKRIAIVGTKRDKHEYEEDLEEWKVQIAGHLLKKPYMDEPFECSILTSSVNGRGIEDTSEVTEWLLKAPTGIINGREADPKRFAKRLGDIIGESFSPDLFFKEVSQLERQKAENNGPIIPGLSLDTAHQLMKYARTAYKYASHENLATARAAAANIVGAGSLQVMAGGAVAAAAVTGLAGLAAYQYYNYSSSTEEEVESAGHLVGDSRELNCCVLGLKGSGKSTLLKNMMTLEERQLCDNRKNSISGAKKILDSFLIDVGREQQVRIHDSMSIIDSNISKAELIKTINLFSDNQYSCVMIVIPTTEARVGLIYQLISAILEEGVLCAPGNDDIHRRIAIVGTKTDQLDYPEDVDEWREGIAKPFLTYPDTKQPVRCSILTTSIKGRGSAKRPYHDVNIDQVKQWLRTVPTGIIHGKKADAKRLDNRLKNIFGKGLAEL